MVNQANIWFMHEFNYFQTCAFKAPLKIKVKYMLLNAHFFGLELTGMINGLTCFGFAGSSVGLQAEAICASASVRSLRVHTDLTACPVIPAFIMICGEQRGYLLNAKCAQKWPKYANPTLNVAISQQPFKIYEYANVCLDREGWVNCCFGWQSQFLIKSTTISLEVHVHALEKQTTLLET